MKHDLLYSLRSLKKAPGFTIAAVLTLALGLGATAVVFSAVEAVLLRALPYPESDRLVWMFGAFNLNNSAAVSPPDFLDYRSRTATFASIGAIGVGARAFTIPGAEGPERVRGNLVSADLFPALGVEPMLGRRFDAAEERAGGPPAVILSEAMWRERFAADRGAIGRALVVDGLPRTIVGVMPPGFAGPYDARFGQPPADRLWLPIPFGDPETSIRRFHFLNVVGRLKPGVTLSQAQRDMDRIATELQAAYRENDTWKLRLVPLHEQIVGTIRPVLLTMLVAVGLVLVIACANVSSLMLARATARQGEIAVRAALGAGRGRLVRQLLTEAFLLSLTGALAGLLVAAWALASLKAAAPATIPRLPEAAIDRTVMLFAIGLSLLTTLMFGLLPALHASGSRLATSLRAAGRTSGTRTRTRQILVVSQVALALVLLSGAGLLVRSLILLERIDPGFDPNGVLTAAVSLPDRRQPDASEADRFFTALLERLRQSHGVTAASAIDILPLAGGNDTAIHIEGKPPASDRDRQFGQFRIVEDGYFAAMRIPIRDGRPIGSDDRAGTVPVIVVDQQLADALLPGVNPLGRRVVVDLGSPYTAEIVGIAAEARLFGQSQPAPATMYLAARQLPAASTRRALVTIVRSDSDPALLAPALRATVRALEPNATVARVRTMADLVQTSTAQPRFRTILLTGFAAMALALTLVGLYGALACIVSQRTREIGIRLALGARHGGVLSLVVRQGATLVASGLALGLCGAFASTRLLSTLLFNVRPTDPLVFVTVTIALGAAGLLAVYLPARRATRVDPVIALRGE